MKTRGMVLTLLLLSLLAGCGKNDKKQEAGFPADFNSLSDSQKVAFVMRTSTPDSVARFVMEAAMGRKKDITIDSLGVAELYVYSNYDSDKQIIYAEEAGRIKDNFSLSDQMYLFKKGSTEDPVVFGLNLGLAYLSRVREHNLSVSDIDKEIKDFKKACGSDTATYRRFVTGFTEALRQDKDKDLNSDIYNRFINMKNN
ncbi:MAG: hypothetical protein K2J23_07880 [Muribaculaceae bacterium]|nr:hypothetical protein [Muribaculaceae bacterium]